MEKEGLSDLNNDFASCTASQNLIIRAEHVVELMHGIDERLDLAYMKAGSGWKRVYIRAWQDLPSVIIFAISSNNSPVLLGVVILSDEGISAKEMLEQEKLGTYSNRRLVPPAHLGCKKTFQSKLNVSPIP